MSIRIARELLSKPAQRVVWRRFALCCVLVLAGLEASGAGAEVPEPAAPARIVSLNPSLSAILLAIGQAERLVGVDDYSAQQIPEVATLPRVGGLFNPSLEAVVALEPDLVVLVPSAEQRDFRLRLQEMGIAVEVFQNHRFDEVLENITRLGALTGAQEAASARVGEIERTRARVEQAVATLAGANSAGQRAGAHSAGQRAGAQSAGQLAGAQSGAKRAGEHSAAKRAGARAAAPSVAMVLQRDPLFVVGGENFIDTMLQIAGTRNVAAEYTEAYPRVSMEWLIAASPQLLVDLSPEARDAMAFWQQWPTIEAVKHGRLIALDAALVSMPGPALDDSLRVLARAFWGEEIVALLASGAGAVSESASESASASASASINDRASQSAEPTH